jgi:hypothetical protein
MLSRAVSVLFGRELRLLQFRIRWRSSIATALRELKHAVIECVQTGQDYESEFVAHRPQFTLKLCDTSAIEMQDYHFLYWSKKESRSINTYISRRTVKLEEMSKAFGGMQEFSSTRLYPQSVHIPRQQKFWGTRGR